MALGTGNWIVYGQRGGTSGTPLLHENTVIKGKERSADLILKMGASGYPAAGVSMPGIASVGFYRDVYYYMTGPVWATGLLAGKSVCFALSAGTTGVQKMKALRMVSGAASDQQALACTGVLASAQYFFVQARGW